MNEKIYTIKKASRELDKIASSQWKFYQEQNEYGKTHLLQEKNSGEYFLFDQFSVKYYNQDEIELTPLETQLDKKSLEMIFRNLEGVISREEFEEYEDLKLKMEKIFESSEIKED